MVDQTVNSIDKFQNNPHWNNHYYAFYLGPALVISINMEVYVDTYNYLFKNTTLQHDQETWLIDRLREANKPEARKKHPWIIVFGHQPLYCSSSRQDGSCTTDAEQTRDGLEDIFYRWGVDIVIGAHIHNYEREYPMYKGKRAVQSYEDPYRNPKGPVYIVSGAGGCPEKIDVQFFPRPDWNAFADSQFGYGILEIVNRTTVVYQQKAIIYDCTCDYPLQVIDQVEIVQEHHGPFAKFE
ncbi:PREDICTED: acid phosphatase type 7-like [Rhagoletis zephyria]|uniref:acid phosphatase type 7-like n=1 Tax=Rhagoletis zephyria TaxID=28612 RepID=UPI0008112FAF|nr:PREDICTED: acid phosphatase type 7-like [Rhagoletis zephyria]